MGTLSVQLRNRLLDHLLGVAAYTPPANVEFGLFVAGVEVSGNGYARVTKANNSTTFPNAGSRTKTTGVTVTFTGATGSWGVVDEVRVFNASTAELMAAHTLAVPWDIDGVSRTGVTFVSGTVDVVCPAGGWVDSIVHSLLNRAFGGAAYTAEASLQFAYSDGDLQSGGTEITGTGYVRDTVTNDGTTWGPAAGGVSRSVIDFSLGTAGGDWALATHFAYFNAAGATVLLTGVLPAARAVLNGQTETIEAGRCQVRLS